MLENMRPLNPLARRSDDTVHGLLDDVNELLGYIAILNTPDVDAVRAGLDESLRTARRKLLATEMYLAASGDVSPRNRGSGNVPWRTLAAAAGAAALTGFLVVRSRG